VAPDLFQDLANRLAAALKTRGLRTTVQMLNPGTLERTEFKARRVVDRRDLYEEITKDKADNSI